MFFAILGRLAIMQIAFIRRANIITGMVEGLLAMLYKDSPSSHAGAWALGWLANSGTWKPTQKDKEQLISFVSNPSSDIGALYWTIGILGLTKESQAIEALVARIGDMRGRVSRGAIEALGNIGDPRAVEPLLKRLDEENGEVREDALRVLANICEDETDRKLLTMHFDGKWPWLDPKYPIDEKRIAKAAKELKMSKDGVRRQYEKLAERYKLKMEWKI